MAISQTFLVSASLGLAFTVATLLRSKWNNKHLPPGPKKLPLIGNLLDMPTYLDWEVYAKYGKQVGEPSLQ
jgi:hypothetical protein